jgi:hypothetical protein
LATSVDNKSQEEKSNQQWAAERWDDLMAPSGFDESKEEKEAEYNQDRVV